MDLACGARSLIRRLRRGNSEKQFFGPGIKFGRTIYHYHFFFLGYVI